MERKKETKLEQLLRLQAEGKISNIEIKISDEPQSVDPETKSKIHPVICISFVRRDGKSFQISPDSLTERK